MTSIQMIPGEEPKLGREGNFNPTCRTLRHAYLSSKRKASQGPSSRDGQPSEATSINTLNLLPTSTTMETTREPC